MLAAAVKAALTSSNSMGTRLKTSTPKPTVSIIGAGRLGTALAIALNSTGHSIGALVARRTSHARRATESVSVSCIPLSHKQMDRLPASDILIIATPDDAVANATAALLQALKPTQKNRTVLHTSGALSSEVLKPLAAAGFQTGSMHPLVSVSDPQAGAIALQSAFYCLEGSPFAMRRAHRMVKDLGGRSFAIEARHKSLYHAAAVMSSGHVTALIDLTMGLLAACGLDMLTARKVLLPLLESTWKNLAHADPAAALTGTFARGDEATVQRHLAALQEAGSADALSVYRLLALRSLQLFAKNHGDPAVMKRITAMLKKAAADQ